MTIIYKVLLKQVLAVNTNFIWNFNGVMIICVLKASAEHDTSSLSILYAKI